MSDVILDAVNSFVDPLTPAHITGTMGIEYLLIFFLVFSIIFAATGYTPLFKDPKYRWIRVLIAVSMGYMTTTLAYVTIISSVLSYFGFFAAFAIGMGSVLYYIFPKDYRQWGLWLAVIAGGLLTIWLLISELAIDMTWLIIILTSISTFMTSGAGIALTIIIIIMTIMMIIGIKNWWKE